MFNTEIFKLKAYTNRDFVNFGLHKANTLYDYKFTSNDRMLLDSGAISLVPLQMYDLIIAHDSILNGEKKLAGEKINYKDFEIEVLMTLIRTGIVKCVVKEDYNTEEKIIKTAKAFNYTGKTFKQLAEDLEIDFSKIKEKFGLKQNATKKKITEENIEGILELLK